MDTQNPSSLRVLIRPPSSSKTSTSSSFTSTPTLISPSNLPTSTSAPSSSSSIQSSSSQSSRSSDGVVVVGFIGRREADLTQLINRILDYNVFGSGKLDKSFSIGEEEEVEVKEWFHSRRISYYNDEEKGTVFLQFVSTRCPAMEESSDCSSDFDSMLEEQQHGELQGMLLMFSVCHVIIYLQEGSRFNTKLLKKFKILQSAKHALVPFMKSQIKPTSLNSRVSSLSSNTQTAISANLSKNSSPGRGGGVNNRHSSAISVMSGLGSYSLLFPGQCTPVVLFVFLDDFPEAPNIGSSVDDSADSSSLIQSLSFSGIPRPSLPVKNSSSVVMLSRPVSKSGGGLKKKLQSSLEAQIRFLIKKCRTLAGSDGHHAGSRGGGNNNAASLFSLEASRAVALLNRSSSQRGESLNFTIGLVEEVLSGKLASDALLLESHYQSANREDIQSIKDFIYRQSDTLRGRGGLVTNTNTGSASGVGMVAVAAAAAAASVAPRKPHTTPELPSFGSWLSSSQLILETLLSVKLGLLDESEGIQASTRKPVRRNASSAPSERIPRGGTDPAQSARSWLETGKGQNMKFSTSWCKRSLPAAMELYLKGLPACYPTSVHEAQLEKALIAFRSMVKGPAVDNFTKKLEDECTSIWKSGRQLCDAVSLTGKPCMHQRHNIEVDGTLLGGEVKPHSSGFSFLHACACGRSRRLRDDPFDFKTANVTFNCFPNCHNLLPALQLPEMSNIESNGSAWWSLIRIGGARYYEPSKGLLQSGFCSTEKFLLKWTILLEKWTKSSNTIGAVNEVSAQDSKVKSVADEQTVDGAQPIPGGLPGAVENQKNHVLNKNITSGRGLPHLRRPFSEVVAGSIATDAAFPPLQQRKQSTTTSEKSVKQSTAQNKGEENVHVREHEGPQRSENLSSTRESSDGIEPSSYAEGEPFIKIGSNVIPVTMNGSGKSKPDTVLKNVIVYFGFEYECPHGHRFILTSEHLNELGSFYASTENHTSSTESSDRKAEASNFNKNIAYEKVNPRVTTSRNKGRNSSRSNRITANSSQNSDRQVPFSGPGKDQNQTTTGLGERLQSASLDDGGSGSSSSLLNRNLPIYMNCPLCRISNRNKEQENITFASTVSQLQRIFLVTPSFPTVLATHPVVQFQASCLPLFAPDCERQSQFSTGCRVILPPESFLVLRFPFVYGVQLDDKSLYPLHHLEHQPELTAWLSGGTILQLMSKGSNSDWDVQM